MIPARGRRRAPVSRVPAIVGWTLALALIGGLTGVIVHDSAEKPTVKLVPGPTVTATTVVVRPTTVTRTTIVTVTPRDR